MKPPSTKLRGSLQHLTVSSFTIAGEEKILDCLRMKTTIIIFFRIILWILGVGLIYLGLFLNETEEGEYTNKLEDLWIRIDDLRNNAITRNTAFIKVVFGYISSVFDLFFGEHLLSFQSIAVTCCYAISSLGFMLFVGAVLSKDPRVDSTVALTIILPCSLYGLIPAYIPNPKESVWMKVWFIGFIFLAYWYFISPFIEEAVAIFPYADGQLSVFPIMILAALLFGVGIFVISITFVRKGVKYIASVNSNFTIILSAFFILLPIIIFYMLWKIFIYGINILPLLPHSETELNSPQLEWQAILIVFWFLTFLGGLLINIAIVPFAIILTLFMLIMLSHRLIWPIAQRPIYALQRLELANKKKFLVALGVIFEIIAFNKLESFFNILKIFW